LGIRDWLILVPLTPNPDRYAEVSRVLIRVFFLNLAVAVAKIMFGYLTGAVSILSDGFHSLTDSASNIVALVGVHVARRPPDDNHPYGHRKYETIAAATIVVFLAIVVVEIGRTAFNRVRSGHQPEITPTSFAVMTATLLVNLVVARYERRAGARLTSEVLFADALHTRSDVFTSLTVIAALAGTALGFPLLDSLGAAIVVGFIGYAGFKIARDTSRILSDEIVIAEADIREVVMGVPDVLGCHHIRTRGSADHVFLDLHVWMAANTRLEEAHRRSHEVKDRLMARYPQIMDAVIHIEPPPREEGVSGG
jgi:cation diffusion facilitator family transporter